MAVHEGLFRLRVLEHPDSVFSKKRMEINMTLFDLMDCLFLKASAFHQSSH